MICDWEKLQAEGRRQMAEGGEEGVDGGVGEDFFGGSKGGETGMTAPRLTTSAIPPTNIRTAKRGNCLLRRSDNLDQRRLNILGIFV